MICIYRSPLLVFSMEFINLIESLDSINYIIVGDFNYYFGSKVSFHKYFTELVLDLSLIQHVDFATHVHNNILDLVITNPFSEFSVVSILPSYILTDHVAISFSINYKIQSFPPTRIFFRN